MDHRLRALLDVQAGAFSAAEAARVGADGSSLRRLVGAGELVRVRRGAYVDGERWQAASPDGRYVLFARAVLRSRPGCVASHHTAAPLLGLPPWDVDLRRVHVLGQVRDVTVCGGVVIHPLTCADVVVTRDGLETVDALAAVVTTAIGSGVSAGTVVADAALHSGALTLAALRGVARGRLAPVARRRLGDVLLGCDPASEAVGETRLRLLLRAAGIDVVSQAVLTDRDGFVARVDLLAGGSVVVEFDGAVKYAVTAGTPDPQLVLVREKRREDRIRALGREVVRVVWADLDRPRLVVGRVRDALARSRPPGGPAGTVDTGDRCRR